MGCHFMSLSPAIGKSAREGNAAGIYWNPAATWTPCHHLELVSVSATAPPFSAAETGICERVFEELRTIGLWILWTSRPYWLFTLLHPFPQSPPLEQKSDFGQILPLGEGNSIPSSGES